MKKILTALATGMLGCMTMMGQTDDTKTIKRIEATPADYITLLNNNGYEAFAFDISALSDAQYYITFKVKEYRNGEETNDDVSGGFYSFTNMTLVSEFPEESQSEIKPEEMADPERGIYSMSNKIMIGFIPAVNDSIRPVMFDVDEMGSTGVSLKMEPLYHDNDSVNGEKFYWYMPKPFKPSELTVGKFIPLVLYGSGWYDARYGIHRFCGEKELEPDMSSKIIKEIPNYYIIGIELHLVKELQ
ncbi:MAG: DUF5041 domain-containing protein [Muribaculaceae bacterium]|nr:DUF5041 domain-containing protein [Muribaculaceae bacterium]